jgi:hypothetical protein
MKKSKFKNLKKDFSKSIKSTKKLIETEGPKLHNYFKKVSASASKTFEVPVNTNNVDLSVPVTKNKINLEVPVTRNKVDLVGKPQRLKKIKGNLYWDLR